jgi:murein DD-endopeptidase MepM/ murein hydrolase activator NlpD
MPFLFVKSLDATYSAIKMEWAPLPGAVSVRDYLVGTVFFGCLHSTCRIFGGSMPFSPRGKVCLSLGLCLGWFFGGCASLDERVRDKIEYILPSQEAQPGDVVKFSFKLPAEIKSARVFFLKRAYTPFARRDLQEPVFTAFMAVPWQTVPGDYEITCVFRVAGLPQEIKESFPFLIVPLVRENAPERIKLKNFDLSEWEKEGRQVGEALSHADYQPEHWQDFVLPLGGEIRADYGTARIYNNKAAATLEGMEIEPLAHGNTWDVTAAAKGKVLLAQAFPLLGNVVLLDHGFSFASLYAHLHSLNVRAGETVSRGTKLGRVGHTGGAAVGDRLLFQVFVAGIPVNVKKMLEASH